MRVLVVIVLWIAIGFVNWGFVLGDFTHKFPDQRNTDTAAIGAILGPLGVIWDIMGFIENGVHWRLKPMTTEERWKIFHAEYPELDRIYFNSR